MIRAKALIMVFFVGLVLSSPARGERLYLKENAVVEGENIFFRDLVKGPVPKNLGDILLGSSPFPGETREIGLDQIQTRLQSQVARGSEAVELEGPKTIKVERASRTLEVEELMAIVESELGSKVCPNCTEVLVEEVINAKPVVLPKGPLEYFVSVGNGLGPKGQVPVSITFVQGERFRKKVGLVLKVMLMGNVVVAKRPIQKGRVIGVEDIEVIAGNLVDYPKDVVQDPKALLGKATKRALSQGEPFRANMLEASTLVKRGGQVWVVLENAHLKVTTLGVAWENGGEGDTIRVVTSDTKKLLYARVVARDTVVVEF